MSGSPQSAMMGLVLRDKPTPAVAGNETQVRVTRYGEKVVQQLNGGQYGIADEGSYFVATNPTPLTALAANTNGPATLSETAGYFLVMRNTDGSGGRARRIYLDFLRLIHTTQVITSATAGHYFFKLGPLPTHYTSGGSALTPLNVNGDSGNDSIAAVNAGALTTVADSAARLVDRGMLRSVITVLGDEWIFKFGTVEAGGTSTLGGTVALRMTIPCPPIIVPPGWHLSLGLIFPSGAATPSFEIGVGWWER